MFKIIGKIVKQHITQACTDDQAYNQIGHDVLDLIGAKLESLFMFEAIYNQKKSDGKSHNIHQTVILELEPADFKNNRANMLRQVLPPVPKFSHNLVLFLKGLQESS